MSSFDAVIMTRGLLEFCLVCSVQAFKCAVLSTVFSVLKCAQYSAQHRAQYIFFPTRTCAQCAQVQVVLQVSLLVVLNFKCDFGDGLH